MYIWLCQLTRIVNKRLSITTKSFWIQFFILLSISVGAWTIFLSYCKSTWWTDAILSQIVVRGVGTWSERTDCVRGERRRREAPERADRSRVRRCRSWSPLASVATRAPSVDSSWGSARVRSSVPHRPTRYVHNPSMHPLSLSLFLPVRKIPQRSLLPSPFALPTASPKRSGRKLSLEPLASASCNIPHAILTRSFHIIPYRCSLFSQFIPPFVTMLVI